MPYPLWISKGRRPAYRDNRSYNRAMRRTIARKLRGSRRRGYIAANPTYGKVPRNTFGVSQRVFAKHVYSQLYTYTCGAAGVFGTEQVWNLNSMFDPDQTGVGHQQYLRDQYASVYNRYKVIGCSINQTILDAGGDGIVVCNTLNSPSNNAPIAAQTPTIMAERPGASMKYINDSGSQVVTYNRYVSMQKLSGLTKRQFDTDFVTMSTIVGSNPSLQPTLRTVVAAADGVSTPDVKIMTRLTYYCVWYDRITQAQS